MRIALLVVTAGIACEDRPGGGPDPVDPKLPQSHIRNASQISDASPGLQTINLIIRNDSPDKAIKNIEVRFRKVPFDSTDVTAEQTRTYDYLGPQEKSLQLGAVWYIKYNERYSMDVSKADWVD